MMPLLVGLGNPGPAYAGHRHNIGFMALDAIAARYNAPPFRDKFSGHFTEATIAGTRTLLLKPQTFMNLSGRAVQTAMQFYKIPLNEVIVFHDELDLAPGKLRIKQGGGAAGHNGLRSIDETAGQGYWRVRLGIGHPGNKDMVSGYVLSNFNSDDKNWLAPLLEAIAEHTPFLIQNQHTEFMNKLSPNPSPSGRGPAYAKATAGECN